MDLHRIQTGDLLLCRGTGWLSKIIEWVGTSSYSHIGILVKNPSFLCNTLQDGIYVWDSSYGTTPECEEGTIRFGVQLHRLEDVVAQYSHGSLFVRHVQAPRNDSFYTLLTQIHKEVHAKPYDLHIMDWIAAKLNMIEPFALSPLWKHTDRFWCSALVSYIYVQLGWIKDVNWSVISPKEFSSTESTGRLLFTCIISDEIPL
jgi:hypothetical protein